MLIVDARGRVLADSAGAGTSARRYAHRPEIAAALRGTRVQDERAQPTRSTSDLLATAVPIVRGGGRVGAVRVTQSVDGGQPRGAARDRSASR